VLVVSLLTARNPLALLQSVGGSQSTGAPSDNQPYQETAEEHELSQFVRRRPRRHGRHLGRDLPEGSRAAVRKTDPRPVHGRRAVGLGNAQSQMGPFYCPADHKLYIDLSFYQELRSRFGAPGDFAQRTSSRTRSAITYRTCSESRRKRTPRRKRRARAARMRFPCASNFRRTATAGVWANRTQQQKQVMEQGDLEEAIGAAQAVGDDRLQMQAQAASVPESFNARHRRAARALVRGRLFRPAT